MFFLPTVEKSVPFCSTYSLCNRTDSLPSFFLLLQLQRSNQTQVYLGEVSPSLAGNLSCEVTTDDNFITRMVYTNLIVAGESRCRRGSYLKRAIAS